MMNTNILKNVIKSTLLGAFALAILILPTKTQAACGASVTNLNAQALSGTSYNVSIAYNPGTAVSISPSIEVDDNTSFLSSDTYPTNVNSFSSAGVLTQTISVIPGKTYYFRSVATVQGCGVVSDTNAVSFTVPNTPSSQVTVSTLTTDNLTRNSVGVRGMFTTNQTPTNVYFEYAKNSFSNFIYTTSNVSDTRSSGTFSATIDLSNFDAGTTIVVRAVAGTVRDTSPISFVIPGGGTNPGGTSCSIGSFVAYPDTIQIGSYSTLSWTTSNCTSVSINGTAMVTLSGQTQAYPTQTSTYILTGTGSNGVSVTKSLTITVINGGGNNGGNPGNGNYYGNCANLNLPCLEPSPSKAQPYTGPWGMDVEPWGTNVQPWGGKSIYDYPSLDPLPRSGFWSRILGTNNSNGSVSTANSNTGTNGMYGCKDPLATNPYMTATYHNQSLCVYKNGSSSVSNGNNSNNTNNGDIVVKGTSKSTDAQKLESTNLFGAAAIFGKGFFPSTIWGWLLLIFLIFLMVVLSRTFFGNKKA